MPALPAEPIVGTVPKYGGEGSTRSWLRVVGAKATLAACRGPACVACHAGLRVGAVLPRTVALRAVKLLLGQVSTGSAGPVHVCTAVR